MKQKPKWKPELVDQFVNTMNHEKINEILSQMNTYPQSQQTVEYITGELQLIFNQAHTSTYPENNKKFYKKGHENNKSWFGPKCSKARSIYHNAKNEYTKK